MLEYDNAEISTEPELVEGGLATELKVERKKSLCPLW